LNYHLFVIPSSLSNPSIYYLLHSTYSIQRNCPSNSHPYSCTSPTPVICTCSCLYSTLYTPITSFSNSHVQETISLILSSLSKLIWKDLSSQVLTSVSSLKSYCTSSNTIWKYCKSTLVFLSLSNVHFSQCISSSRSKYTAN